MSTSEGGSTLGKEEGREYRTEGVQEGGSTGWREGVHQGESTGGREYTREGVREGVQEPPVLPLYQSRCLSARVAASSRKLHSRPLCKGARRASRTPRACWSARPPSQRVMLQCCTRTARRKNDVYVRCTPGFLCQGRQSKETYCDARCFGDIVPAT